MGLYVYAVGRPGEIDLPPLNGILDRPVKQLEAGSLCAVVSDCPHPLVRAERRNIAASQRVLNALHAQFDLLPMAFGTVTKSDADLRRFLDEHRDLLTAQLQRIAGAVEMGLRLSLEVPDPIAYLVERTPTLQTARERTFHGHRPPSYDAKIRLGQLCEDALRRYRDARTAQVVGHDRRRLRGGHDIARPRRQGHREPGRAGAACRSRSIRGGRERNGDSGLTTTSPSTSAAPGRHTISCSSSRSTTARATPSPREDETMFLIDDLLAAPLHGLVFVLRKIDQAVQEEIAGDERTIMAELSALHRSLDAGAITEAEFDAREQVLLQRLDRLHGEEGTDANGDARV